MVMNVTAHKAGWEIIVRQVSTQYWMGDHCETGQYTILNVKSL